MNQEEMATGSTREISAQPKRSQRKTQTHTHVAEGEHVKHDVKLAPEKKSKTPLVLGVILAILVLIGAAFFAWYFFYYSHPEKVAFDAMSDFLESDDVMLEGTILLTPDADTDSELQQIELDFNSSSNTAPSAANLTMKFIFQSGNDFSVNMGTVTLQDGVVYLQISGIMDVLEVAGITEELPEEGQVVVDFLDKIDGEWWEISVDDLLDEFGIERQAINQLQSTYDCAMRVINQNYADEFSKLYRAHNFVNLTKVKALEFPSENNYVGATANEGSALYRVEFNYSELADFINAVPESGLAKQVYACIEDNVSGVKIDASDFDEISVEDVKDAFKGEFRIYFEISNWCHRLKKVVIQIVGEDTVMNLHMNVYHQNVAVSAPESYRPITDLIEEIMEMTFNLIELNTIDYATNPLYIEEPWNN